MTDLPGMDAVAASIHAAFATTVSFTGGNVADVEILAVKSDVPGDTFQGMGATTRQVSFEIRQSDLPDRPKNKNLIVEGGITWSVIEVRDRHDVGSWVVLVELGA